MIGITVAHADGYSPVCLECVRPMRLALVTRLRSGAYAALVRHALEAHS